ncbi:MAG: phosphoenolpyruvate carboxykinase (GTP) [Candidatus Methanomethylicia archaeon]
MKYRERLVEGDYDVLSVLKSKMDSRHLNNFLKINNSELHRWIADIIVLCEPSSVYVNTGSDEDIEYFRRIALERGEELPSKYAMHTVHFDGIKDLARDRKNTRILIEDASGIPLLNTMVRSDGLNEIKSILKGIMRGKDMFIGFYCLGPKKSPLSLYAVQVTDSAYVMHSENILYRLGYDIFVEKGSEIEYMRFLHSAGELNEYGWSKNIDKRRIFIDLIDDTVYSANTQYAGNTVGLKKLALRLTVYRGYLEGWLSEHMFIVGVKGPGDRITYLTGAFPAGCGKTSTALMSDTVIGDDLAIIREVNGIPRAINPEIGMFGIIDGVNPTDDPEMYEILTSPETEVIFSNILLMGNGEVWWNGKIGEPKGGLNYAGVWWPTKKDESGSLIPPSHTNARFTTHIRYLKNLDPKIEDPDGVPVGGMIFGGRDSDTWVPVEEGFSWEHGIVMKGAALESERTTAVLGRAGEREFNPYAILDFISISIGKFTELHFKFGEKLKIKPKVFGVNYFLRDENGKYLAEKIDKKVWLKWMELRVHDDIGFIELPTGRIPIYEDLVKLFGKVLNKEYPLQLYEKEFTVRIPQHLAKIERIWKIYEGVPDTPSLLFQILREEKERLKEVREKYGDYVSPLKFDKK